METLIPRRSSKKHRSDRSGYALSTLIAACICLFSISISGNAKTIDIASITIISNISERIHDLSSGISQARKETSSKFVFDKNLQTCFDNLFSDVNIIFSMSDSIRVIALISVNMKTVVDESYVNRILSDELRVDISYFENERVLMNENAGLCPNNDVVVSRTRQAISLLDELLAAMRSAQSKITSQR
jgi:hypothetical protein